MSNIASALSLPGVPQQPSADAAALLGSDVSAIQSMMFKAIADGADADALLERIGAQLESAFESSACRIVIVACDQATILHARESPTWVSSATAGYLSGAGEDPLLASAVNGLALQIPDLVSRQADQASALRAESRWPKHAALALMNRARSCIMAPFALNGGETGAIAIYSTIRCGEFDARARTLEAIAPQVGHAIAICRQHEKSKADANRFHSLSKSIPGVVYQRLVTPQGDIRYTYISESAYDLFGVEAERIINDPEVLFQNYDADYRETFRNKLIKASEDMVTWDVEAKIRRTDGQVRYTHAIAKPSRQADGSVLWTGVILNAERIKQAEQATAQAEAKTRESIVENMSQGMVLFDKDDRLIIANSYFCNLYPALAPMTKPGTHYEDFVRAEYDTQENCRRDAVRESLTQRLTVRDRGGYISERRVGDDRWIMVSEFRTINGGTVILHTDVSELKSRERLIHHLAFHDVLTGLPNRVAFRQKLNDDLIRARQSKASLAVLCLDLDGFKYVNDTLGHPAGDELLVQVAGRIRDNIRETDTAARLGGDEFAIVVSENVTLETVTGVAWRLLNAMAESVEIRGQRVTTTTSIGVAFTTPGDEADPDILLKNADLALYRSKADGRNTFRFFEAEMDAIAQKRRVLENDLRLAVERDELELYFQPLVDVYTEEMMGAEALVRWQHPQRGLIAPVDFIALAEETGIIVKIGAWVLRRACMEAAQWPGSIRVAVNLSPAQFKDRELVRKIAGILEETGLDPKRLELEVTESLLLQDTTANLQTLNDIKSLGVRISMDDFGTGYSSLGNLRSFPFDKIKIDRSFVNDLENNPDAAAIIRAVLSLGRGLGMTTTAEGVETRDQLAYLRAEGCTEVQGFYFSEPRPASEVAAMLRDGLPRAPAKSRC